jgi:hypothetical protein
MKIIKEYVNEIIHFQNYLKFNYYYYLYNTIIFIIHEKIKFF